MSNTVRYSSGIAFLLTSPAFKSPVRGVGSCRNIATPFGTEKLEWCGYRMVKKFRRYVYSFWHDPRTWQTDGQTDTAWRHRPRLCIASRGKSSYIHFTGIVCILKARLIKTYVNPELFQIDDMFSILRRAYQYFIGRVRNNRTRCEVHQCQAFNGHIKKVQQRTMALYSNTVIGTLAVDGWAVTFGTARRGLGRLRPGPVPSSLYQM